MKKFKINGLFEAENLDDAFERLSAHFTSLAKGHNTQVFLHDGFKMEIEPLKLQSRPTNFKTESQISDLPGKKNHKPIG